MFGLDWAWGHISPASLSAVHAEFACRYLSHDESKNLQLKEAKDLTNGHKSIVVVWETTAMRAAAGFAAGQADAREAMAQARKKGKPDTRPIFFAVDFDATGSRVFSYFRGIISVLGLRRTGAYGGYRVIKALFDAKLIVFGWQTYAWSGGLWDPRAHLQQYSNDHRVAGVSCDYNRSNAADYGQWHVGQVGPPAPPKDPLWFMRADERAWVKQYNSIRGVKGAQAKAARQRLLKLMEERRRFIHLRSTAHGGKGWNIWHRRERYHVLKHITVSAGLRPTRAAA